jgi:hypothetical protein
VWLWALAELFFTEKEGICGLNLLPQNKKAKEAIQSVVLVTLIISC